MGVRQWQKSPPIVFCRFFDKSKSTKTKQKMDGKISAERLKIPLFCRQKSWSRMVVGKDRSEAVAFFATLAGLAASISPLLPNVQLLKEGIETQSIV